MHGNFPTTMCQVHACAAPFGIAPRAVAVRGLILVWRHRIRSMRSNTESACGLQCRDQVENGIDHEHAIYTAGVSDERLIERLC